MMDLTPLYIRSERESLAKKRKAQHAEERGNYWLAAANMHEELGRRAQAQRCFDKGQRWLDRMNKLLGNG